MKRQAANHPKMLELADRLEIGRCFAVGVMETLWNWASEYAQDGAVRCSPRVLAKSLDYEGDPGKLVEALVGAGFLDQVEGGGWLIHGWSEHCEDYVHTTLVRDHRTFADGTVPKDSRLHAEEREKLRKEREERATRANARERAQTRGNARESVQKSTTDTDTDTSTLKEDVVKNADTERLRDGGAQRGASGSFSGSADSHSFSGTGSPEAVGAVLDRTLNAGKAREEKITAKAASIVGWTGEGPEYAEWWAAVIRKALASDIWGEVAEHLDYAESCVRDGRTKDLGELTRPGAFVASRIAPIFHRVGARLPRAPRASPGDARRASV